MSNNHTHRTPTVKTVGYEIGHRYAISTQPYARQNRVAMTDFVALGFNPMF